MAIVILSLLLALTAYGAPLNLAEEKLAAFTFTQTSYYIVVTYLTSLDNCYNVYGGPSTIPVFSDLSTINPIKPLPSSASAPSPERRPQPSSKSALC